jgi:hypothetical protein
MRDFAWRRIREKDLSLRIEIFGPNPRTLASLAHRIKSGGKAYFTVLRWSGGFSEEPEPDPIPNSAVKLLRADGTKSQDLGE